MDLVMVAKEFGVYAVAVVILALVVRFLYTENKKLLEQQRIDNDKREAELKDDMRRREAELMKSLETVTTTNRILADSVKDVGISVEDIKSGIKEINYRLDKIEEDVNKGAC